MNRDYSRVTTQIYTILRYPKEIMFTNLTKFHKILQNLLQVFDSKGTFIRSITLERATTTLRKPLAVAVDKDGNVAVCDTGNHKVWLL